MRITSLFTSVQSSYSRQKATPSSQFTEILQEKTAEQSQRKKFDTNEVGKNKTTYEEIPISININNYKPTSVTGSLSEADKLYLQEKYNFSDMNYDSKEYHSFMQDLHQLGVISHPPKQLPLGIVDYSTDANGNITEMFVKVEPDEANAKVQDWFTDVLSRYAERYQKVKGNENCTKGDELFSWQYESNLTIRNIVEELFNDLKT